MTALYFYLKNLLDNEEGQDLIEYALLLVLIVLVVAVALPAIGTRIEVIFGEILTELGG